MNLDPSLREYAALLLSGTDCVPERLPEDLRDLSGDTAPAAALRDGWTAPQPPQGTTPPAGARP